MDDRAGGGRSGACLQQLRYPLRRNTQHLGDVPARQAGLPQPPRDLTRLRSGLPLREVGGGNSLAGGACLLIPRPGITIGSVDRGKRT